MPGNVAPGSAACTRQVTGEPSHRWPCLRLRQRREARRHHSSGLRRTWAQNPNRTVSAVVTEDGTIRAQSHSPCCLQAGRGPRSSAAVMPSVCRSLTSMRPHAGPRRRAKSHQMLMRPTPFGSAAARMTASRRLCVIGHGRIDPDLYRYARTFWPAYQHRRKGLKLSFGKLFFDQARRSRNWSFDKPSPFKVERVRDPAPDMSLVDSALAALINSNPGLIEIAEALGRHDRRPSRCVSCDLVRRCASTLLPCDRIQWDRFRHRSGGR